CHRTTVKPSAGIGYRPCKGMPMHNSNSATCPIEGKACLKTIKRRYVGVVLRLIRVMGVRCLPLDVFIIQDMVCLRLLCERICGTTSRQEMVMTMQRNGETDLLMT